MTQETNSNNQLLLRLCFIHENDFPAGKYTTDYSLMKRNSHPLVNDSTLIIEEKQYKITGINSEIHSGTFIPDRATDYLGEPQPYNVTITLYLK